MVVDFIPLVRRPPEVRRARVPTVVTPGVSQPTAGVPEPPAGPRVQTAPTLVTAPASAARTHPGLSAVLVEPAPDWTARPPGSPSSDPFASRSPPLPGQNAQTFRMREPPSPARMVARIGVLFGADGKTGCSEIGNEIAGYTQAGDRAALQRAIEYERRHCRP